MLKSMLILPINYDTDEHKVIDKDTWIFTEPIGEKFKISTECNIRGLPLPSNKYKIVPMIILVQAPYMNHKFKSISLSHLKFDKISQKPYDLFSFKINKHRFGRVENIFDVTKK